MIIELVNQLSPWTCPRESDPAREYRALSLMIIPEPTPPVKVPANLPENVDHPIQSNGHPLAK